MTADITLPGRPVRGVRRNEGCDWCGLVASGHARTYIDRMPLVTDNPRAGLVGGEWVRDGLVWRWEA